MGWSWQEVQDTPLEVIETIRARMSAEHKELKRQRDKLEKSKNK